MKRLRIFTGILLIGGGSLIGLPPTAKALEGDGLGRSSGRSKLFVSPSGQPFRAAASEPYPIRAWFAAADNNRDGRLDKAEFRADTETFFHTLDQDHDGAIGGLEVTRYETEIVPEMLSGYGARQDQDSSGIELGKSERAPAGTDVLFRPASFSLQQGGGSGGGGGGGSGKKGSQPKAPAVSKQGPSTSPQGAAPYGLLGQPEPVTTADRNFDGRITLAEFLANADRNFTLLDARKQGFLTLDGLPRTAVELRSAR